jgi:hypothetical protein
MPHGDPIPDYADGGLSLQPWDPQPREPGTSFAGLVLYRETPPPKRSLRDVARRLGRSLSIIERHSSGWQWVSRTHAWDAEQARIRGQQARQVEADWVGRHADTGKQLQALGLAGLGLARGRNEMGELSSPGKLKPRDLIRMVVAGSALEVTAASHSSGTLEVEFVQRLIEIFATVFTEANQYADAEARAQAFQAGCLRALQELVA